MSKDIAIKKGKYEIDMVNGPLFKGLVTFFVPLMISGLLQLLFNAVDLVVVGRFAGSECLAAVGATTALIHMFSNMIMGISVGANVIAARYIALGEKKEINETLDTSVLTGLLLGFFFMILGLFFSRFCLELMETPKEIIDNSAMYMRIYFCGMQFMVLYNYGAALLRAAGNGSLTSRSKKK